MKKNIYNLASWFLDKESINELKENSEGNIINNLVEASGLNKTKVIFNITARIILQTIRYSFALYLGYYFLYFGYHLVLNYTFVDSLMFIYVFGLFVSLLLLLLPLKRLSFNFFALILALFTFYLTTIYYNSLDKDANENLLFRETVGIISGESEKKITLGGDTKSVDLRIDFLENNEEDATNLYSQRVLTYGIGSSIDYTNWELKYEFTNNFALPQYLKMRRDLTQYDTSYAFINPTDDEIRIVYDQIEGSFTNTTNSDQIKSLNFAKLFINPDFKIKVVIGKNQNKNNNYLLTFDNSDKSKFTFSENIIPLNCSDNFINLPEDYQLRQFNSKASCTWIDSDRSYIELPSDSYVMVNKD